MGHNALMVIFCLYVRLSVGHVPDPKSRMEGRNNWLEGSRLHGPHLEVERTKVIESPEIWHS